MRCHTPWFLACCVSHIWAGCPSTLQCEPSQGRNETHLSLLCDQGTSRLLSAVLEVVVAVTLCRMAVTTPDFQTETLGLEQPAWEEDLASGPTVALVGTCSPAELAPPVLSDRAVCTESCQTALGGWVGHNR